MSRGKYANRAEAAKAREEAMATAQTNASRIVALEKALAKADRENLEQQAHYIERVRTLSAQVAAGTSEKVERLEAESNTRREKIEDLEDKIKRGTQAQEKLFDWFVVHLMKEHRYTSEDAVQMGATLLGANGYIAPDLQQVRNRLTPDVVYALDLARGRRTKKAGMDGMGGDTDDLVSTDRPW